MLQALEHESQESAYAGTLLPDPERSAVGHLKSIASQPGWILLDVAFPDYPNDSHGARARARCVVYIAGFVRTAAPGQPKFPAALAGADCERDRRLVLH